MGQAWASHGQALTTTPVTLFGGPPHGIGNAVLPCVQLHQICGPCQRPKGRVGRWIYYGPLLGALVPIILNLGCSEWSGGQFYCIFLLDSQKVDQCLGAARLGQDLKDCLLNLVITPFCWLRETRQKVGPFLAMGTSLGGRTAPRTGWLVFPWTSKWL